MNWSEVIGQEDIKQKLTSMVDDEHVPHAMILCGPYGCGKMAMAMAMASYLLTEGSMRINPQFNKANSEAMLGQWEHPDLHFSFPTIKRTGMSADHQPVSGDYAKEWRQMLMQGPYFNISQWMDYMDAANQQAIITGAESDELARKLSLKSSLGGYKVASEEPEKLLDTIKSRTQRIDMKRLTNKDICDALVQQRGIDEAAAQRIARLANGNWMNALDALNTSNENRQFFDMFTMLMRLAYTRNIKELKKWSEAVAAYGREKQRRMLVFFIGQVRENFMYNFRNPELTYMTVEEENFSKKFSPFINELNVIEISELMERANRDIGQNANAKIVMFDMALKMIVLLLRK